VGLLTLTLLFTNLRGWGFCFSIRVRVLGLVFDRGLVGMGMRMVIKGWFVILLWFVLLDGT